MSDDTTLDTTVPAVDTDAVKDEKPTGAKEHFIPKSRFDDVNNRMKSAEQEAEELRQQLAAKDKEVSFAEARGKYGEELLNDEKVQAVREKYPDLAWDDAITLAGVEQPQQPSGSFVGRPAQAEPEQELTLDEQAANLQRAWQEGSLKL